MKTTLLFTALLVTSFSAFSATIFQGTGEDYVKFEAGSYFSLSNTATSVITDNGDGTLTTTSRNDSDPALLTYQIDFATTGNYYLYFQASAANASSDSLFVTSDFDVSPAATSANSWNNFGEVSGSWVILNLTAGSGVEPTDNDTVGGFFPNYNGAAVGEGAETFSLASAASPVELRFRPREAGLVWENIVLSTNAGLTATELDNLSYSVIPEPSTLLLVSLTFGGILIFRRRR